MKRCPKCNSKASAWRTEAESVTWGKVTVYDVQCPTCGMGTSYGYNTEEEAITAWEDEKFIGIKTISRKYAKQI